jgi:hypothetical protein
MACRDPTPDAWTAVDRALSLGPDLGPFGPNLGWLGHVIRLVSTSWHAEIPPLGNGVVDVLDPGRWA